MDNEGKLIPCCICAKDIEPVGDWLEGSSAEPVADGRCCNQCDMEVVVPARIKLIWARQARRKERESSKED